MTRTDDPELALHLHLETLIALHGARRVMLAALAALVRPRMRPPLAEQFAELDDHMRRDIGLPPRGHSPPMPHWSHFGW
ncbi:hypothetical protein CKO11_10660 [Rhodobacter sp. TJ_12]|uniref:hypothetical protein n=1 Tax=Rhodobacter sp. TJ_12 TaxID=2029399 RepID=UPI001CC14064|nr:hypothetical protein [Rhodobacter sp. TJ_12]MBZ4022920.1 hypothetical protein [Rhodobacter sp. TJ_12]